MEKLIYKVGIGRAEKPAKHVTLQEKSTQSKTKLGTWPVVQRLWYTACGTTEYVQVLTKHYSHSIADAMLGMSTEMV